jgi:hypothetical protein
MLAWQHPSSLESQFFGAKIGYIPLLARDVEPVTAPYEFSAAGFYTNQKKLKRKGEQNRNQKKTYRRQ